LLSHAGQDDVYTQDNSGNAPRDLYIEPPEYEFADGEHLGAASLRNQYKEVQKTNATVAHATGSAHAAVKGGGGGGDKGGGGGGSGLRKEAQGAGFAGEAAYSASGNDDAVNEYLSSIRQRAGQSLGLMTKLKSIDAPKPHRVPPRGVGGGHDVNSLGWDPTDVVPPAPVDEETLLSLRRPTKP